MKPAPTFEDIQKQANTLHGMMVRNCKPHPVPAEEIKDMIEKVFHELGLDLKNSPELQRWCTRIVQGFGLRPRMFNRKGRRNRLKVAEKAA